MHVLPRVGQLHEQFAGMLEVVGVHAGKFPAERHTERISAACERLGVSHPVINDRQFRVWRDYAVQTWPTVAIVDPAGYLIGVWPGEFDVPAMAEVIAAVVARAREQGTLVRRAASAPVPSAQSSAALRFPSRVLLHAGRLWIADTGNGRVLECSWDAEACAATVSVEHGGFLEPRGLAAAEDGVYVADRAGQAIWRLTGERTRVAGTGRLADGAVVDGQGATGRAWAMRRSCSTARTSSPTGASWRWPTPTTIGSGSSIPPPASAFPGRVRPARPVRCASLRAYTRTQVTCSSPTPATIAS
jgi:hypothetical protein